MLPSLSRFLFSFLSASVCNVLIFNMLLIQTVKSLHKKIVTTNSLLIPIFGVLENSDSNSWHPTGVCYSQDDKKNYFVANPGRRSNGICFLQTSSTICKEEQNSPTILMETHAFAQLCLFSIPIHE